MTATQQSQAAARWEDYVDVFVSPAQLFRRRADDGWVQPFLVLLVASIALYYLFLPVTEFLAATRVGTDPAAIQAFEAYGRRFLRIGGIFLPITLGIALGATALWLRALAWIASIPIRLRHTALIACFAAFIPILGQLATGGLGLYLQRSQAQIDPVRDLSFGILRFLPAGELPAYLVPVLGRIDIFPIWQAGVWTAGLCVLGGCSVARAATVAAVALLTGALPGVLGALVGQGFTP